MRAVVRPLRSRVIGIALLLLAGLVVAAPPASAVSTGSITLRAACPYLGAYDAGFYITESFTGLAPPTPTPYSFKVVATRDIDGSNTFTMDPDTSGWYTEPDGSHTSGPTYDFAYNGGPVTPVVAPGDTYNWTLYKTYGTQTVELSGQSTVGSAIGCSPPPPPGKAPAPASFAASPHRTTVNHHGRFHYSFAGKAGVHGTISVARSGHVWASGTFTVPSTGTETIGLRVSRKVRHYLAAHHRAKTAVTVVLTNGYGSRSAGTTLVLRWA